MRGGDCGHGCVDRPPRNRYAAGSYAAALVAAKRVANAGAIAGGCPGKSHASADQGPPERVMPRESIVVLRGYNNTVLQPSGVTGIYRMHDAVDLAAAVGEPVKAMADGTVEQVWEEGVENACVVIQHTDGTTISYAGMSAVAGLQAGDPVQRGQTIGFAGPGPMDESDMEPHLHLRVTKNGASVDPAILLTE